MIMLTNFCSKSWITWSPKMSPPPMPNPLNISFCFWLRISWAWLRQKQICRSVPLMISVVTSCQSTLVVVTHCYEIKAPVAGLMKWGWHENPQSSRSGENSQYTPWFGNIFSHNKFKLILKFLDLVNIDILSPCGCKDYGPCTRFQPLIDMQTGFSYFTTLTTPQYCWMSNLN
jgi:hypothetical protein